MEFVINRSLIKVIEQVVDEDGSVKDSAVCFMSPSSFLFSNSAYCVSGSPLILFGLRWHILS